MPELASHPFVKYVSSVAGHHVERYGTGAVIGGRRQPAPAAGTLDTSAVSLEELMTGRGAGKLEIDETAIVALTGEEWARHRRAYERALRKGGLKKRSAAEYWSMIDVQERLSGLIRSLEAASPGATAELDEVTEESVRAAIEAHASAERERLGREAISAPYTGDGEGLPANTGPIPLIDPAELGAALRGESPPPGTLPAEPEPIRLTDAELAELRAETPLDRLEAEVVAAEVEGRSPSFAITPDGTVEGGTDG
jgi:hypothetical protein